MLSSETWHYALSFILLLGFVAPASTGPLTRNSDDDTNPPVKIINRDVCIIGGGSAGTYAAIRLRASGKTVTLIEKRNRLGGHIDTYIDPVSGLPLEAGVEAYHNTSTVRDYFEHFNITLSKKTKAAGRDLFVDFTTGKPVDEYPVSKQDMKALKRYGEQLEKYPFLNDGFESLPDQIPEDLLLPFGKFVHKYDLHGIVRDITLLTPAMPNRLDQPTLYVAKMINSEILKTLMGGESLASQEFGNGELYKRAQAELTKDSDDNDDHDDDSLLLNATIKSTRRTISGVNITVQTPSGIIKVHAKKLIIAIPPQLNNMANFDLDDSERSVFSQLQPGGGEAGGRDLDGDGKVQFGTGGAVVVTIIHNANISADTSIFNTAPNTAYNYPVSPATNYIQRLGVPGYFAVAYSLESCEYVHSNRCSSDDKVRSEILGDIARLRTAGTVQTTQPEFVYWTKHDPLFLGVNAEAIRGGFYKRLNALQGHRNTYYTGATFQTHDSSLIWDFTERYILSRVLN